MYIELINISSEFLEGILTKIFTFFVIIIRILLLLIKIGFFNKKIYYFQDELMGF